VLLSHSPDIVLAHAKVNLMLRIVGRRPEDGYHLLEMINVDLSLADELTIRFSDSSVPITIKVIGDSPKGTPVSTIENPATSSLGRGFSAFCATFSVKAAISVTIKKRIPVGAGLGGGTSDAAALLRWCWNNLLSDTQRADRRSSELLNQIAITVGADVPYSLRGGCAIVTGIGEEVAPLPWKLSGVPLVLVVPPTVVPTPAVFAAFREEQSPFSEQIFNRFCSESSPLPPPGEVVGNDLESVVSSRWPAVGEALTALKSNREGLVAGMTGSGSALFCLAPEWTTNPVAAQKLELLVKNIAPHDAKIIPCYIR